MRRKTRAAGDNRDPMSKSEEPVPWYKLNPEDALNPWDESQEPELPGIPFGLGPASRCGAPVYNPMTVQPPGIDPGGSLLAELLHWKI